MSTMYYTLPDKKSIGQTHSLGRGKGYHFTWCIYPLDFCTFVMGALYKPAIIDEYGSKMSIDVFVSIAERATSQSFDERII